MEKKILNWELIDMVFIIIFGSLDHFLFDWTKLLPLAFISPVNESVWEHTKLVIWPGLIYFIIEYKYIKGLTKNFFMAKAVYLTFTILAMIGLYYLYIPMIGHGILAVDIGSFFVYIYNWAIFKL